MVLNDKDNELQRFEHTGLGMGFPYDKTLGTIGLLKGLYAEGLVARRAAGRGAGGQRGAQQARPRGDHRTRVIKPFHFYSYRHERKERDWQHSKGWAS